MSAQLWAVIGILLTTAIMSILWWRHTTPVFATPAGADAGAWKKEQRAMARKLVNLDPTLTPSAPAIDANTFRWPVGGSSACVDVENCTAYGYNESGRASLFPGTLAMRLRHDGTASTLGSMPGARTNPDTLRALLERDGLIPLGLADLNRPLAGWIVAVFVEPGEDYHVIRRDRDGTWSQKPGRDAVEPFTRNGAPTARQLLRYHPAEHEKYRFVGFYQVQPARINSKAPLTAGRVLAHQSW